MAKERRSLKRPVKYQVAIPTYHRAATLQAKTLQVLVPGGVPRERITIFANDPDEIPDLKATLDQGLYGDIVPVEPAGLRHVRNHVARYYEPGTPILSVDDDITGLRVKEGDQNTSELVTVDLFVQQAFTETERAGISLWGIYPVNNPYFMKDRVRTDLCYIIGCFWGVWNPPDDTNTVALEDKEDYERSIKFYLRDGAIARFEWVAPVTNYYGEAGGMQETRTEKRVTDSAWELVSRFPDLASINESKKSGHTELRLKDQRGR
jgi:hypothetical protein